MTALRALLPLLLTAAVARAGSGENSLARLLPAETAVFFETRNPSPEEYQRMALAACLEEPGVRALLERLSTGDSSFTSMRVPLGTAAVSLSTDIGSMEVRVRYVDAEGERSFVMRDRLAVGVVGLQPGPVPVDLVAALEVEGDAVAAVDTIEKLLLALTHSMEERIRMEGGEEAFTLDARSERFTVRGTECIALQAGPVAIYLAPLAPQVVLATSRARLEDLFARHAGERDGSLARDPAYLALAENAIGTGTITSLLQVRLDRVLDAVRQAIPAYAPIVDQQLKAMGLAGFRSLSSVTRVEGRGVSSTTSIRLDDTSRGLGRFFRTSEPASFGPLRFAPRDTLYVTAGRVDAAGAWDAGLQVAAAPLVGLQVAFEQRFGARLREDLLELVGPEGALIVATNRGLLPDVGIVLESKDPERLVGTLRRMLDEVSWPPGTGVRTFSCGEFDAHTVIASHPRMLEVPIAPTFAAVDGKYFVLAPFPLSFQRLLAVHRGERESLDANPDYAALRPRVPEGVSAMSYLDLPRLTALVYETLVPILQSLPNPNQVDSILAMPDAQYLVRHLYGRIAWTGADEEGKHWYSHASFDSTGMFLGMLGGAAGASTLFLRSEVPEQPASDSRARPSLTEAADASICLDRVRTLRARLKLYSGSHGGALPATLDDLRASHVDDETFDCPGSGRPYAWLGSSAPGRVILHGFPNGADGNVTIIDRDLNVRRVTPDELSALLRPSGD